MLIKIDGILMSAAPEEGSAGGGATGAADGGADNSASGQESSSEESGDTNAGGENNAENTDGDDFGNDFDFDSFLQYDPFANPTGAGKEAESGSAGEQGAGQDPAGQKKGHEAGKTGQGEQGPQAGTGQEPGQQVKDSPEMVLLRNQVQHLTQMLNQQQQQAATAGQQAAQAGQAAQPAGQKTPEQVQQERHQSVASKLPPYQFQIPQDILQKMGSDDPGQVTAGLQEFAKGVASVTHYNVAMQFEERIAELEKQLLEKSVQTFKQTTEAEAAQKKAQATVFDDFYGKFPELNKPELQLFVKMQAQQLAQQYGVQQWSPEFRDQLGTHVKKVLGMGVTQDPPSNGGAQNQQNRKPGTRFNAGAGTGRQTGSNDLADDIAATLLG